MSTYLFAIKKQTGISVLQFYKEKLTMKKLLSQRLSIGAFLLTFCCLGFPGTVAGADISYVYDDAGRIVKEDHGTTAIIYKYDPAGNLLEVSILNDLPGVGCPLSTVLTSQEDIDTLRRFRDRQLQNSQHAHLVTLYYKHAGDIASILAQDPVLTEQVKELIERNTGIVGKLTTNGSVSIEQHFVEETIAVLGALQEEASSALKDDLEHLIQEIENGCLLKGIGLRIRGVAH